MSDHYSHPHMADLANLAPRITGSIEQMRTFAFAMTNYVDDYRKWTKGVSTLGSIQFQIDRLIELNENLTGELPVAKELITNTLNDNPDVRRRPDITHPDGGHERG